MDSIFSKIIKGDIACYKILEDEKYFSFLDINPLAEGHTLVVPKNPIDDIFDLSDEELSGLFLFAKKIGKAIKKNFVCKKIGIAVIGIEVAHAHIHLVPINGVNDIDFKKEKLKLTNEEFIEIVNKIKKSI